MAVVLRFALVAGIDAPWVAPDEMLYALLGESVWETTEYGVLGLGASYYGIYGLLPGGLVAAFGPSTALVATQVVQVLAVGGTGLVSWFWARRVASPPWPLAAAALTLALPGLTLAGLMMSEALFVAGTTIALFAISAAVARPSTITLVVSSGAILLAAQIRLQGLLLLPLFALSAIVTAAVTRDSGRLRAIAPALIGLGGWAAAWLAIVRDYGGQLGAYSTVLEQKPSLGDAMAWIAWHGADVIVIGAALPAVATLALVVLVLNGTERDRDVIALVVTTVIWSLFMVVTVGIFAAQHVGHLAGRNLLSVAPPLFVCFAAWAAAGHWRRGRLTLAICAPIGLLLAIAPESVIGPEASAPDALELVPVSLLSENLSSVPFRVVWVAMVAVVLGSSVCLARFGPRAAAAVTIGLVVALAATSVVAADRIRARAAFDRNEFFGGRGSSWIDETIGEPTVLLDEGSYYWNDYWHQAYWNDEVEAVASVSAGDRSGRLPGGIAMTVYDDGSIRRAPRRLFVAQNVITGEFTTLVGTPRTRLERSTRLPDLVAWRTNGRPVVLSTRMHGIEFNGVATGPVRIQVFRCRRGRLEVPIKGLGGPTTVSWRVAGHSRGSTPIRASWDMLRIPLPDTDNDGACLISLTPVAPVALGNLSRFPALAEASPTLEARPLYESYYRQRAPVPGTRVGYCLGEQFLQLTAGQPRTDPAYRGAVPASYVDGVGLTCAVPPSFRQVGYAGPKQNVAPGIYPFYRASGG